MKLNQLLLFSLCLFLFACNIESVNIPEESQSDSTLIKKIIITENNGDAYTVIYDYDSDNRLTTVESNSGEKNTFTYENNRLARIDHYLNSKLEGYIILEYDSDNKVISYIEYLLDIEEWYELAYHNILTYIDDQTLTRKVYRGDFTTQTELLYNYITIFDEKNILSTTDIGYNLALTYDSKNGIYKNIFAIEVLNLVNNDTEFGIRFYGNMNNPIEILDHEDMGGNFTDTYQYTYNDSDYPKTANIVSKYYDSVDYEATIEYFYE